jgi:predicted RNase H-like nuclease (RuvC/YqgF family)
MTTTNKEAKEFEKMLDNISKEPMTIEEEYRNADVPMPRGPNDLEETIKRLEFRNNVLHKHNTKQMDEIMDLRAKIAKLEKDAIDQFRNKGEL